MCGTTLRANPNHFVTEYKSLVPASNMQRVALQGQEAPFCPVQSSVPSRAITTTCLPVVKPKGTGLCT